VLLYDGLQSTALAQVLQGHTVAQLFEALRHKVAGSIPDGVIANFH
jgi:hypothetical protein